MRIPRKLTEIAGYLSQNPVALSRLFPDGRINASANEREVIKVIGENFDIAEGRKRAWFDFSLTAGGVFYPVNLKIADVGGAQADNLNCKLGIYYALTGRMPEFANEISWFSYFKHLKADLGARQGRDYFFLVINKRAKGDVFVNSLRGLSVLHPAGNNLPFQCVWEKNRRFQKRSFDEAVSFIMKPFGESIKQRSQIYGDFKSHFPDYV